MNQTTQTTNKARTAERWRALFLLFVGVAFFACGGSNGKTNAKSDGTHVFRNANFGMSQAQIKASETEAVKLTIDTPEKLTYTADMGENDFSDIIYHFNSADKLIEIEFNLYFDDKQNAQDIHAGLIQQFNRDYKSVSSNSWIGTVGDTDFQVFARRSESITRPGIYVIWQPL